MASTTIKTMIFSLVCLAFFNVFAKAQAADKDNKIEVKQIKAKSLPITLGGGGGAVTPVKNLEELEKLAGKKAAQELAAQVDFQKQQVSVPDLPVGARMFG